MSLKRSPDGVEAMELDRYWHPKMNWFGPAGIGSMRRISGFRNWHQKRMHETTFARQPQGLPPIDGGVR